MKKILIGIGALIAVVVVVFFAAPTIGDPECHNLRNMICEFCGDESEACEKVGETHGADTCAELLSKFEEAEEAMTPEDGEAEEALCDSFGE